MTRSADQNYGSNIDMQDDSHLLVIEGQPTVYYFFLNIGEFSSCLNRTPFNIVVFFAQKYFFMKKQNNDWVHFVLNNSVIFHKIC